MALERGDGDALPSDEHERRFNDLARRMLAMPHKPHEPLSVGRTKSPSNDKAERDPSDVVDQLASRRRSRTHRT